MSLTEEQLLATREKLREISNQIRLMQRAVNHACNGSVSSVDFTDDQKTELVAEYTAAKDRAAELFGELL